MRIFIYALPSAGASLFAFWLSQLKDSIGVIDMYANERPLPRNTLFPTDLAKEDGDMVVKATVATYPLDRWWAEFKPDRAILYVRDPYQNYCSLVKKAYRDYGMPLESKFAKLDRIFHELEPFNVVVRYEDFITKRQQTVDTLLAAGIPASMEYYQFDRGMAEVVRSNWRRSPKLREKYHLGWGEGNVHGKEALQNLTSLNYHEVSDEVRAAVNGLCPNLVKFYEENHG